MGSGHSHSLIEWLREKRFVTLHPLCFCFKTGIGPEWRATGPTNSAIHRS